MPPVSLFATVTGRNLRASKIHYLLVGQPAANLLLPRYLASDTVVGLIDKLKL